MKTAIEQIKEKLKNIGFMNVDEFFVEFLETEKQQIIDAYQTGEDHFGGDRADKYYNETYITNKETLK